MCFFFYDIAVWFQLVEVQLGPVPAGSQILLPVRCREVPKISNPGESGVLRLEPWPSYVSRCLGQN